MTATLEKTSEEKANQKEETAPYIAGEMLSEMLEAAEMVENHVLFGSRDLDDTDVVVQVFANLATRIRKQALAEELVRPLDEEENPRGTCGRLTVGDALMEADSVVYDASSKPGETIKAAAALLRRLVDLQDALRVVLSGRDEAVGDIKRAIGRVIGPQLSQLTVDALEWARTARQKGLLEAGEEWSA